MHTTRAFTFIAVESDTFFRIPASKRICMNVEVFQNKARRKNPRKFLSRAYERACEDPNAVGKCKGSA